MGRVYNNVNNSDYRHGSEHANKTNRSNFRFFHNPNEDNGYLSNWYRSRFTIDGVTYTSAEQYMMHKKALLFNDIRTANAIMRTSDVREIKQLGREVTPYNDHAWASVRQEVMYHGLLAKFTQNRDLGKRLLMTGNAVLAECAVKDTIWGIGLSMTSNDRFYTSRWRGQNLLGITLMEVRDELRRIESSNL